MRVEREPVQIGSDHGWSGGFEVERDDEPGPAGGVQRSRGICQGTDAGSAGGSDEVIGVVGVVLIRLEDGAPCCAAARRREEIDENRVFVDVGPATVWSDAVGGDEPCGGRRGRRGEDAREAVRLIVGKRCAPRSRCRTREAHGHAHGGRSGIRLIVELPETGEDGGGQRDRSAEEDKDGNGW